eukprot:TRINITY_DN31937_c0_g1_i1.p1 TRINITY_DN31937_c0_g1~~TRINITY_DN31937_c0_g1_i1.p1  ORF type:complete len:538 (-),score=131.86 TRINITY_DN31937_c0_g1_i1:164-1777(-)
MTEWWLVPSKTFNETSWSNHSLGFGDSVTSAAYIAVFAIVAPVNIALLVIFLAGQQDAANISIVKIRGFWNLVWTFCSLFLIQLTVLFAGVTNPDCLAGLIPFELGILMLCFHYVEYCGKIYMSFVVTEEIQRLKDEYNVVSVPCTGTGCIDREQKVLNSVSAIEEGLKDKFKSWILQHRAALFQDKPMTIARLIALCVSFGCIGLSSYWAQKTYNNAFEKQVYNALCMVAGFESFKVILVLLAILFTIAVVFCLMWMEMADTFRVEKIFKIETALIIAMGTIFIGIGVKIKTAVMLLDHFMIIVWLVIVVMSTELIVLTTFGSLCYSILKQTSLQRSLRRTWASFTKSSADISRGNSRMPSVFNKSMPQTVGEEFQLVMTTPALKSAFQEFLCDEFSAENMSFWDVLNDLRSSKLAMIKNESGAAEMLVTYLVKMNKDFVMSEATFVVNLSHKQRVGLSDLIAKLQAAGNVFDQLLWNDAEEILLELQQESEKLLKDSFFRFKLKPQFIHMLELHVGESEGGRMSRLQKDLSNASI